MARRPRVHQRTDLVPPQNRGQRKIREAATPPEPLPVSTHWKRCSPFASTVLVSGVDVTWPLHHAPLPECTPPLRPRIPRYVIRPDRRGKQPRRSTSALTIRLRFSRGLTPMLVIQPKGVAGTPAQWRCQNGAMPGSRVLPLQAVGRETARRTTAGRRPRAALTADLSEDLRDAWERLRETAAAFRRSADLRVAQVDHVLAQVVLLLRVRPKRQLLEVCVFLGRVRRPRSVVSIARRSQGRAYPARSDIRDEVETPITDWLREGARPVRPAERRRRGKRTPPAVKARKAPPGEAGSAQHAPGASVRRLPLAQPRGFQVIPVIAPAAACLEDPGFAFICSIALATRWGLARDRRR